MLILWLDGWLVEQAACLPDYLFICLFVCLNGWLVESFVACVIIVISVMIAIVVVVVVGFFYHEKAFRYFTILHPSFRRRSLLVCYLFVFGAISWFSASSYLMTPRPPRCSWYCGSYYYYRNRLFICTRICDNQTLQLQMPAKVSLCQIACCTGRSICVFCNQPTNQPTISTGWLLWVLIFYWN